MGNYSGSVSKTFQITKSASSTTTNGNNSSSSTTTKPTTITPSKPTTPTTNSLVSIKGYSAVASDGKVINRHYIAKYKKGKRICPINCLTNTNGSKITKDKFVTYYYKNNRKGTASAIVKGINSKGYKDSILVSFKIA